MKRLVAVSVLTVLAALVAPTSAWANHYRSGCPHPFVEDITAPTEEVQGLDRNGDGLVCVFFTEGGPLRVDNVLL